MQRCFGGWTLLAALGVLAILLAAIGVAQARDPARRPPKSEAESGDEPE